MVNTALVTAEEPYAVLVSIERIEALALHVLGAEGEQNAELSILITDDVAIRDLNFRYAAEDKPTDVLSFSLREGEGLVAPDEVARLGDVVISFPTAERQAKGAGRETAAEIDVLLVHGILHLLGYDHAEAADERVMFARTEELLATP